MKKLTFTIAMAAMLFNACAQEPVETPKDRVLQRLYALKNSGKIAYGHQDDLAYGHNWRVTDWENDPLERSDVKDVCGHYPELVGFDLGGIELADSCNLDGVPFGLIRKAALEHIDRGGMVTFSWHPRNPLTGGDAWDVSSDKVVKSILEGGEKHAEFMLWLQRAADFVESLGPDACVIFRPWHEHTGSWFWWGEKLCSESEYQELYRLTWRYFNEERGLAENIYWCYSPCGDAGLERAEARYPGNKYVDLLGVDTYEYVGDGSLEQARDRYRAELRAALTWLDQAGRMHQKPICLSETGLEGLPDATWWTQTLFPILKDYPVSYVLTWRNAWDKPGHFYAPWDGLEGSEDFKAFTQLEEIEVL